MNQDVKNLILTQIPEPNLSAGENPLLVFLDRLDKAKPRLNLQYDFVDTSSSVVYDYPAGWYLGDNDSGVTVTVTAVNAYSGAAAPVTWTVTPSRAGMITAPVTTATSVELTLDTGVAQAGDTVTVAAAAVGRPTKTYSAVYTVGTAAVDHVDIFSTDDPTRTPTVAENMTVGSQYGLEFGAEVVAGGGANDVAAGDVTWSTANATGAAAVTLTVDPEFPAVVQVDYDAGDAGDTIEVIATSDMDNTKAATLTITMVAP